MIDLDNRFSLVIHLKMTGQLVAVGSSDRFGGGHPTDSLIGKLPDRSTRIILTLDKGNRLFFNDQRKFGWIRLLPTSQIKTATMLGKVGPEPLGKSLDSVQFIARVRRRPGANIKAVLLDQQVIAGIGNIYADESLFLARINPRAKVSNLTNKKLVQLLVAIRQALRLAIDKGGSTDRTYRQADGSAGSYLLFAQVFRRQDQPCPRCHRPIKKIRVAGRGTHYCSYCQRMPRLIR
jgi:formamidopyrimidine-DNA glycosylase